MSHQSDLPPHVPSCVSTGAGVTVPDATSPGANETRKIFVSETPTTATLTIQAKPTPDATATPRTDQDRINSLVAIGIDATEAAQLVELAKPAIKMQEELAAAKAEIELLHACLTAANCGDVPRGWDDAIARAERAEAALRERTQWQCACGGTDCAGQAENERLRAEVTKLKAHEGDLVIGAAILEGARKQEAREVDQLRARVAELEANGASEAFVTMSIRASTAEQKVIELEKDRARVDWLEKGGKVASWEAENDQGEKTGVRCWELPDREADECFTTARAAIDAARAGKGAT